MKYVVILAVAFAVAVGVVPYVWSVRASPPPTPLEREVKTRSEEPPLLPDLVELTTREAVAEEPGLAAESGSPLEIFLAANPGSPLGLLPPDEAARWMPTRENLVVWVTSVDELDDVDVDAIEWTDDLRYLWGVCREQMALYSFVVHYQDREVRRWHDKEQSVSFEAELMSVGRFMDRHIGNDPEVWRLTSLYTNEVSDKIRGEGEHAGDRGDVKSCWDLHAALVRAGAPSFDAMVELLRRNQL